LVRRRDDSQRTETAMTQQDQMAADLEFYKAELASEEAATLKLHRDNEILRLAVRDLTEALDGMLSSLHPGEHIIYVTDKRRAKLLAVLTQAVRRASK